MDREGLVRDLADTAREAGEAILTIVRHGFDVEAKGDSSPVTEADRAAELVILDPIPTAGLTYDDRDRLRDSVRAQIAAELAV